MLTLRSALRARGGRESGQSLVIAIVLIAALTISTAAVIAYTTSGETNFGRDTTSARTLAAAEAGLNAGLSVAATSDPNNDRAGTLPASGSYTLSVEGMPVAYAARKTGSQWVVTATAKSHDGRVIRTLEETLSWNTTTQQVDESRVYSNGLFVSGTTGCTTINGAVLVRASVFVNNDLCLVGGVTLQTAAPHTYSVYVKGAYQGRNNTAIGTRLAPFATATIIGGCSVQNRPVVCSTAGASNVYADGYPNTPSTDVKPDVDGAEAYASGVWASPRCTRGSFRFDDNGAPDKSLGTVSLLSGSSFDCTVTDAAGNFVGSLAWNRTTSVLTVSGTIFIDGNLSLSNSGRYIGDGTVYVNGTVDKTSNIALCGPGSGPALGSCATTWDPELGKLGFVVLNPQRAPVGVDCTGSGQLDVVLYVVQGFSNTGGTTVTGPVVADAADIGGSTGLVVPSTPPDGMPITHTITTGAWGVLPGSWKQLN